MRWQDLPISARARNVLRRQFDRDASVADARAYWRDLSDLDRRRIRGAGPETLAEIDSVFGRRERIPPSPRAQVCSVFATSMPVAAPENTRGARLNRALALKPQTADFVMNERSHQFWDEATDTVLESMVTEGRSVVAMAMVLGRSQGAVRRRLSSLGLSVRR